MDSDDYKELREQRRVTKLQKQATGTEIIQEWCDQNGATLTSVQDYQLRLRFNGVVIDLFPQSHKYHNITANQRGKYKKTIDFLNSFL